MNKGIGFIILCFFIIFISLSYGEGQTVYQEVYYDAVRKDNYFDSITEALSHVAENGTLYICKPIRITSQLKSLKIDKAMTIKGESNQEKSIIIEGGGTGPVFNLGNTVSSFRLENIYAVGVGAAVVKGHGECITIINCNFEDCMPIDITSAKVKEIVLDGNRVIRAYTSIRPASYGAKVAVKNNYFGVTGGEARGLNIENCEVFIENNRFNGVSLNVYDGEKALGLIQYNTFERDGRKIMVTENDQKLHFQNNKIYKDAGQVYYRGNGTIDFTKNWWGSKEGPKEGVMDGNIDYSNWALFEDFRRYQKDSYTLTDLQDAYDHLKKDANADNWIYDMDKNNHINFLDIIAITRSISE
ncbi:hypothetical protein HNQ80_001678 [Anaerosolibacter carboniphilus]|uniref:Right handed beta helix domain-containing protein n=1 Tax=Anaerosolibacter carboniphilus TaxID=1417629 RepID=A0A841KZL5_9FIRM|nr:hypothetical protein [Anaerosolibacter carboniphilus]MBB6215589.1 hypothetical protein [Anaerosolibacter carboniphilus]